MDDPALPGAAELLGASARALLAPAVRAADGQILSARPTQVRYDPGRRLAVRYAARVQWPKAERVETLGALLDAAELPAHLDVVEKDGIRVGVWRYPHDPYLPGLAHAAYPRGVRQLLRAMNLPAESPEITPLVYRPCRRAVLRVRTDDHVLYLKVVPPAETAALRGIHAAFAERTPAARCLAWADELGLLVLEELPGAPMTRTLADGGALPAPSTVADLLRDIRAVDLPQTRRPRRAGVAWYAQLLRQAVPEASPVVDDVVAAAADLGMTGHVTTHGDLYPAQLLINDGALTGLLDLDGAGTGSRVDDPAVFLAHLLALAHVRPSAAARITAYRREVQAVLCAGVDPRILAATVTGVLLGIATTAFRRQEPDWRRRTIGWLELAQRSAQEDMRSGGLF